MKRRCCHWGWQCPWNAFGLWPLRVEADTRGEKITRKIAENASKKVPFLLVVGDREKEAGTIAVRARGATQGTVMPLAEAVALIQKAIAEKV